MKQLRVGMGTTVLHRGMASSGIDGIGHYTKELVGYFASDTEVQLIPSPLVPVVRLTVV